MLPFHPFWLSVPSYQLGPHSDKPNRFVWLVCINSAAAAAAKSLQSCPTLCDPIDSSPLGSSVPGILQAYQWPWLLAIYWGDVAWAHTLCIHVFL